MENVKPLTKEEVEEMPVSCPVALIKRDSNESYKDWSARRSYTNKMIRLFCKGLLFHDTDKEGTYNVGRRIAKTEAKEVKRQRIKARKAAKKNEKRTE